jgi:HEAT repeat protein
VALALHLDAQPRLTQPIAPEVDAPDGAAVRARIEGERGVTELATSLAPYGTPPIAPPAQHADREALERELLDAADTDVSRWKRRSLRTQVRKQAARQAQAEDELLAAEQRQLQADLDNGWAELRALRHRAAQETDESIEKEMARRESARAQQQAILDREWQQLKDADSSSVTASLRAALPDEATTPLGFLDGVAVLTITCPDREDLIAETEPAFTSAGHRAVRARSEIRGNDLYLSAIASRILAAVGRALSTTPAVEAVTCIAVRACESSTRPWEPIYVGTFERAYAERLVAEGRWSPDPDVVAVAVEEADEVDLELNGSRHGIAALDLSRDPGLAALIDRLDPMIRSDENAAHRSDQEAVKAFLGDSDTGHDGDLDGGEEQLADLQHDRDTATQEPPEMATHEPPEMAAHESDETSVREASDAAAYEPPLGAQTAPDESMRRGFTDGSATSHDDAASGPVGDPLPAALKDNDGSVRRAAVEAIGRRNDPNDTPLLLQSLSDQDDIVRLEAMYALKDRLSPDLRRDTLIKACGDSDEIVRRKAIEALADLADERDTPVLLEALKDPDDRVRLEAIYAVRYRLAPDMRDALINACSDVDEGVRRKAIEALGELGDERDTPLLLKALKDSDPCVRLEAIYALEGRSALGPSSRLSEPLLEAMKADDAIVRQAAVRLFGRLEERRTAMPPT